MKISLRDLFWVAVFCGVVTAWWVRERDLREQLAEAESAQAELQPAIQRLEETRRRIFTRVAEMQLPAGTGSAYDLLLRETSASVVVAVSNRYIEIPLGSDDGIQDGERVQIYRGEKHICRATIRKVTATRSVAETDKRWGKIRAGDEVRRVAEASPAIGARSSL
jgi:hypothetical protein